MHKEYTRSASPTVTAWGYSRNDAVSSHTCDGSCELDRDDAACVAMRHGNVPNIEVVRVVEGDVVLLNRIVIAATTADALGRERSSAILAHEIVTHFDCLS
jgi:choline dehydrogenase-like flavoprotein